MLFLLIRFKLNNVLFIYEINCNIIFTVNSVYVMCICLIYYGSGCDVDLSRFFVTLGRLPGLYKWKCVCQRVSGGSCT
jgi:hypothetical protein